MRVSWGPCAFWAEECYDGGAVFEISTGQPFNLMIGSMNILLIACSLIYNIRNQSFMYLLIFGKSFGIRTDRVGGLMNCGQLLRSADLLMTPSV